MDMYFGTETTVGSHGTIFVDEFPHDVDSVTLQGVALKLQQKLGPVPPKGYDYTISGYLGDWRNDDQDGVNTQVTLMPIRFLNGDAEEFTFTAERVAGDRPGDAQAAVHRQTEWYKVRVTYNPRTGETTASWYGISEMLAKFG